MGKLRNALKQNRILNLDWLSDNNTYSEIVRKKNESIANDSNWEEKSWQMIAQN